MNNYLKTYKGYEKKKGLPFFVKIIYIITALTAVFHLISVFSEQFANFFNSYISAAVRFILAKVTNLIPFSFAEMLLILVPIFAFLLIRHAIKNHADSWGSVIRYALSVLSIACVFYILFFWSYGVGYNTTSLDKKLGLERNAVSAEELYETAEVLSAKLEEEAESITFREKSFSVMPYSISEMSDKLGLSYDKFCQSYDVVSRLKSNIKPVIMSEAMSYTHITGIYTYFTGEANINIAFPDYTLPFTAAHELAHQRGIAREDEANFIAFLVCSESEDPYIRYSGYANMLEYVLNALYSADKKLYAQAISETNSNFVYEMIAYGDFFDKYRHSSASKVSSAINDTYLKLNGTEGERSYGMVVDLAVAYYKEK